jgi:hypothetical protein
MVPPMLVAIQGYRHVAEGGGVRCDVDACPRCGGHPGEFRLHDCRKRAFLYVLERLVQSTWCWLTRWKCSLCCKTFTLYPAFALPFKRYVAETVLGLSEHYVTEDTASYRRAVRVDGMPVFHAEKEAGTMGTRILEHSTLHRWIPFFTGLGRVQREALKLIRAAAPASGVFRRIAPVAPWKYRSPERGTILQGARQFFVAAREYAALFGASIFPRLATACAWT